MDSLDAQLAPDRFATAKEIRAALFTLPDLCVAIGENALWEVASDFDGLVLLGGEEFETLTLLGKIDATAN